MKKNADETKPNQRNFYSFSKDFIDESVIKNTLFLMNYPTTSQVIIDYLWLV